MRNGTGATSLPKRLFIANRGEIARRIGMSARRLGIEVACITDRAVPPDFLTPAVTHFVRVPEETAGLYLDVQQMIQLARQAGADAVHPGFGFLSENSEFADAVIKAGMRWVGPKPAAISAMASKASARDYAVAAKVPVVEGLQGIDPLADAMAAKQSLVTFARKTGYPLLIKAAFGGGGKGMRLVHEEAELVANAERAASEARSSFGNSSLVVERYIGAPRHVEVQVLADQHGFVTAIGNRDCSLQRRHQKIIEEAPAPWLTTTTAAAMHRAACALAASVGYDSAGTVEFLVDGADVPKGDCDLQKFWFLEMNTRLQVEHPVTEQVFGIDLVEWQLRVASGERLPQHFANLTPQGHSVEARIYAEDAVNGFLPAPGPVHAFRTAGGPGIRWEIGLDAVDEVTPRFDPMIAKLVATGETREIALDRLTTALRDSFLATSASNTEQLIWLAGISDFRRKAVTTHFIGDTIDAFRAWRIEARKGVELAATSVADHIQGGGGLAGAGATSSPQATRAPGSAVSPVDSVTVSAFARRACGEPGSRMTAGRDPVTVVHEEVVAATVTASWTARIGTCLVPMPHSSGTTGQAEPGIQRIWYAVSTGPGRNETWVSVRGHHFQRVSQRRSLEAASSAGGSTRDVTAPVPGKVIDVRVTPGQKVDEGSRLFVIESMKMEFEVKATQSAEIANVHVRPGDQVKAGALLAEWKKA